MNLIIELFKDKKGQYAFNIKNTSGEILAYSCSYKNKVDAQYHAEILQNAKTITLTG